MEHVSSDLDVVMRGYHVIRVIRVSGSTFHDILRIRSYSLNMSYIYESKVSIQDLEVFDLRIRISGSHDPTIWRLSDPTS